MVRVDLGSLGRIGPGGLWAAGWKVWRTQSLDHLIGFVFAPSGRLWGTTAPQWEAQAFVDSSLNNSQLARFNEIDTLHMADYYL